MNWKTNFARRLRRHQTRAEKIFWYHVRNRKFCNLKFKRQVPIENYIVDFLCEEQKLIVELDDEGHDFKIDYDNKRTSVLEQNGYKVMRFQNQDVYDFVEYILEEIKRELNL